jgi:hypothetical protein
MGRLFVFVVVAFLLGLGLGNFLGTRGVGLTGGAKVQLDEGTDEQRTTSRAVGVSPQAGGRVGATSSVDLDASGRSTKMDAGRTDASTKTRREGRGAGESGPYQALLKHPPPHIAQPDFFGPAEDPDVVGQREEALNDLITSMREAGLPERDIQAARDEYEQAIKRFSAVEPDEGEPPGSPEGQAADLAQSLLDAGEPEENIQQMLDDHWRGVEEIEQQVMEQEADSAAEEEPELGVPQEGH